MHLADGATLAYDVLVVATGAALVPEETEGLTGPGLDGEGLHLLHARGRGRARRPRSPTFDGGRLVVNVVDMPIKCPVAPLEFCFLADWYFTERGIRDRVAAHLRHAARRRLHQAGRRRRTLGGHARREGHRAGHRVQHRRGRRRRRPARRLRRARGPLRPRRRDPAPRRRRLRRTLAGPRRRARLRARPTSTPCRPRPPRTSSSSATPPTSRRPRPARSPTSRARCSSSNIERFLAGEPLEAGFDGHANCFIETGFHKALLIDFNYDTEPLPGPLPRPGRPAAAQGVAAQPPRQAAVPVVLLAQPAARPRHPRHRLRPCPPRASTSPTAEGGLTHADHHRRRHRRRPQRRGLLHRPRPVDRGDGPRARPPPKASTS